MTRDVVFSRPGLPPLRRRAALAAARAVLTAALCVAGAAPAIDLGRIFDAGKGLTTAAVGTDEKEEIAIGREIAGRVLGAAPLTADPALQQYVSRVGVWLASRTERPDLPWRFGVIDTESVNAFAAPGGYVLITRGLYEMLGSEAELAGVLAHEIAHVLRRHHITVMQKSAAITAGAQLAQRDNRSALLNNMIGAGAEVMARGLDKQAEFDADAAAVVIAARGGYSPYGIVEMLHKLAGRGSSDASVALLFKTHPPVGERLAQLGTALAPRAAVLPAGKEPAIQTVAAGTPAARAARPSAAAPAASSAPEASVAPALAPKGGGLGVDPAGILRGIFGR